jgi:hypothetical protein
MLRTVALVVCVALGTPALAQETVFQPFLTEASPQCVPVEDIKKLGAVVDLSPDQYRFAQALYVFIPPISKMLPPGDRAMLVGASDGTSILLFADADKSCARFLAPDFVLKMLNDIKSGKVEHVGQPL